MGISTTNNLSSFLGNVFAIGWFAYIGIPMGFGVILFLFSSITGLEIADDRIWYSIPWSIVIGLVVYAGVRVSNCHKVLVGWGTLICQLLLTFLVSRYTQVSRLTLIIYSSVIVWIIYFILRNLFFVRAKMRDIASSTPTIIYHVSGPNSSSTVDELRKIKDK